MTPQETDSDWPVSVQESLAEAWVGGGLLQGCYALSAAVCEWDLLKKITNIVINSISLASGQTTGRGLWPRDVILGTY